MHRNGRQRCRPFLLNTVESVAPVAYSANAISLLTKPIFFLIYSQQPYRAPLQDAIISIFISREVAMTKLMLLILTQILLCAALLAQTDDPGCNLFASTSDAGCLPTLACTYNNGYTSTSFTVVCKGLYTIKAWVPYTQSDCAHCASCVAIYANGQFVAEATTAGAACTSSECCRTTTLQLTPGTYELRVSLRACNTIDIGICCEQFPFRAYCSVSSGIIQCP